MANMSSMKITGKKFVTFLIISEQSHTRNLYFNKVEATMTQVNLFGAPYCISLPIL